MRLFLAATVVALIVGFGIGCALGRPRLAIPFVVFVLCLLGYGLP